MRDAGRHIGGITCYESEDFVCSDEWFGKLETLRLSEGVERSLKVNNARWCFSVRAKPNALALLLVQLKCLNDQKEARRLIGKRTFHLLSFRLGCKHKAKSTNI